MFSLPGYLRTGSRTWGALIGLTLLAACGHTPITRTAVDAFGAGPSVQSVVLLPNLRYLRVVSQGRESLMVLGYIDADPSGPIETWYSTAGEVLQLQNGRLVATTGLRTDWRAVRYSGLPAWSRLIADQSAEYGRDRDEMPGYRFGIAERVAVAAVPTPSNARLAGVDPARLVWFEETVSGADGGRPSARFGLLTGKGPPTVVYGEQCLARDLCVAWQRWPVEQ